MKLVIIESPYAGDVEANVAYARRALRHSLSLGEAPIASHLLYTQVLDDNIEADRELGIEAGLAWRQKADASILYLDRGFSSGMKYGAKAALLANVPIYARWLDGPVDPNFINTNVFLAGCCSYWQGSLGRTMYVE